MFRVTFQNAATGRNLTKQLLLPDVPQKGEQVHVRQKPDSWKDQQGTVTDRIWYIVDSEPNLSEVVVMVTVD